MYKQNQSVEYFSETFKDWIPAEVVLVDLEGGVVLNVKPGQVIPRQNQKSKIRFPREHSSDAVKKQHRPTTFHDGFVRSSDNMLQSLDPILQSMVSDILSDMPARPIDFMIEWLLKRPEASSQVQADKDLQALVSKLQEQVSLADNAAKRSANNVAVLRDTLSSTKEEHDRKMSSLHVQLTALQEQLGVVEMAKRASDDKLFASEKEFDRNVTALQISLQTLRKEATRLKAVELELLRLKESDIEQQRIAVKSSETLASKDGELSSLLQRVTELERQKWVADNEAKKAVDSEAALKGKLNTVEKEFDRKVVALEASLAKASAQKVSEDDLRRSLQEAQEEVARLKKIEREHYRLKEIESAHIPDLKSEIQKQCQAIEELRLTLSGKDEKISGLLARVAELQEKVGAAEPETQDAMVELVVSGNLALAPQNLTYVLASVKTPSGDSVARQPSDLVCVLDISGSMGLEATIQGSGSTVESHGLSLLDVAKHGVRTVIKTLGGSDRVAIISFNTTSNVVFPLTTMDTEGQAQAEIALDTLRPMGGTNIWEGLTSGLHVLDAEPRKGRFGHIMLLTDGESTYRETIIPNLRQYKETHERLPGTINTFGFGYNLDSALLVELATIGSGSYSFIPDAGFVGTAFVNTVSNLLVTMAREVYLTLTADDAEIVDNQIMGGYPVQVVNGSDVRINLGTLQYQQTKDIVIPMRIFNPRKGFLVAQVQYETAFGCKEEPPFTEGDPKFVRAEQVEMQRCRCLFVDVLTRAMEIAPTSCEKASALLASAALEVSGTSVKDKEAVQALLEDMQGQATEALSKLEWFKKWGRHYLPSVMFAHRLQQCNNFKDPGVQVYGGELFKEIQDMADDLFNQLPPPKPSIQRRSVVAPTSMATFNDRYAG